MGLFARPSGQTKKLFAQTLLLIKKKFKYSEDSFFFFLNYMFNKSSWIILDSFFDDDFPPSLF